MPCGMLYQPKDNKHLGVLGRIISCTSDGWQVEADPQHVDVAATQLGLENAKGVATPMAFVFVGP